MIQMSNKKLTRKGAFTVPKATVAEKNEVKKRVSIEERVKAAGIKGAEAQKIIELYSKSPKAARKQLRRLSKQPAKE